MNEDKGIGRGGPPFPRPDLAKGDRVRYYPAAGRPEFETTRVRSNPWRTSDGVEVVLVHGHGTGVMTAHLEKIE